MAVAAVELAANGERQSSPDYALRQQTRDGLSQARGHAAQLAPKIANAQQRDKQPRATGGGWRRANTRGAYVGGVVSPAQSLLALVQSNNKGIGFVRPGQPVAVKIESFPYTSYGLTGTVETVSHDAAQDENLGLVFPARVQLRGATLNIDSVDVRSRRAWR